jgi:5'-nucleotidase
MRSRAARFVAAAATAVLVGTGVVNLPVDTPASDLARPETAAAQSVTGLGYWMVAEDGGVFAVGEAPHKGSAGNLKLNAPVVDMAPTPRHEGYWLAAADGGVFAYGDARFHGSAGAIKLNKPIVGIAGVPAGDGYWLVASDGGVFSYGSAAFRGSTGAMRLNQPIVAMVPTPQGRGYWLVAADGGVFTFGDAGFFGSTGALTLNQPIVNAAATPTGKGYWLVARDGGVFTFGDARFHGSTGSMRLNQPIVDIAPTETGDGYTLGAADGGVFTFGNATYLGSASTGRVSASAAVTAPSGRRLNGRMVGLVGYDRFADVQVLSINDFHGNLEPPTGSSGRITPPGQAAIDAGGAEYLGTHLDALRATNPNSVTVSAGDLIGASPLLSALFQDEPTIEAFNLMGLDINAVGNHEFDEGAVELSRMQNGGCHPEKGCIDGDGFGGANFQFLAANVIDKTTGKPFFPSHDVRAFQGARVAFIGMTLEGTPQIVTPSGIVNLEFKDEADTVNALVPQLKARGIETIVVVVHEGGVPVSGTGYNDCKAGISGPIVDIVERLDDEVDIVLSGHTHRAYNCVIDGKIVTSAESFGRLVTDVDVRIDKMTGDVVEMKAGNVIVTRTVAKHPQITALIERYQKLAEPIANRIIGTISADLTRTANAAGESSLGDRIADAQLAATAPASLGGAVIAFMNPGGIRADLTYARSGPETADGQVRYGEAFTVQPFGNNLVTMTYTGAQIEKILEQQFCNPTAGSPDSPTNRRVLQVSEGFTYEWSTVAACGSKVDPASIKLHGVVLDPNAAYRVTMNSFLADGGDSFPGFTVGTNRVGGVVDTEAFEEYLKANPNLTPGPQNRIKAVTPT